MPGLSQPSVTLDLVDWWEVKNRSYSPIPDVLQSQYPKDLTKDPRLCDDNFLLLLLLIAQHSLPYVRAGLMMTSYTFDFSCRCVFLSYRTPVSFRQLDRAASTRRSNTLWIVPSVLITGPRYLKWSTFLSTSPFSFVCLAVFLVVRLLPH